MTHEHETLCTCGGYLERGAIHYVTGKSSHGLSGMTVHNYFCTKCAKKYESREYFYPQGQYPMGTIMYLNRLMERIAQIPIDFRKQDEEFYQLTVHCSWCLVTGKMELPKDITLGAVKCPRCGKTCLTTNLEAKLLR